MLDKDKPLLLIKPTNTEYQEKGGDGGGGGVESEKQQRETLKEKVVVRETHQEGISVFTVALKVNTERN